MTANHAARRLTIGCQKGKLVRGAFSMWGVRPSIASYDKRDMSVLGGILQRLGVRAQRILAPLVIAMFTVIPLMWAACSFGTDTSSVLARLT